MIYSKISFKYNSSSFSLELIGTARWNENNVTLSVSNPRYKLNGDVIDIDKLEKRFGVDKLDTLLDALYGRAYSLDTFQEETLTQ